jgi:hypothetical protein
MWQFVWESVESSFHPLGHAVWYEYEFTVPAVRGLLRARRRKSLGRWRVASMHTTESSAAGIDWRRANLPEKQADLHYGHYGVLT